MAVTALRAEKAYEKYAWVLLVAAQLFYVFSSLLGVFATGYYFTFFPGSEVLGPTATSLIRGLSSLWVGMNLFGLAITLKPYRNGEKWAWYTLWYLPIVFSFHYLLLFPTPFNLVAAAVPFVGLVLPYRKFFPRKQT